MRQFRRMRYVIAAALLFAQINPAFAQLRTIPKEAKRGELRHVQDMLVEIDGKRQLLSAGAQVRDGDNRIVLPSSLTEKSDVRYLIDAGGFVHRVWILSARERAQDPVTLPFPK
jgi:hypothetical protein